MASITGSHHRDRTFQIHAAERVTERSRLSCDGLFPCPENTGSRARRQGNGFMGQTILDPTVTRLSDIWVWAHCVSHVSPSAHHGSQDPGAQGPAAPPQGTSKGRCGQPCQCQLPGCSALLWPALNRQLSAVMASRPVSQPRTLGCPGCPSPPLPGGQPARARTTRELPHSPRNGVQGGVHGPVPTAGHSCPDTPIAPCRLHAPTPGLSLPPMPPVPSFLGVTNSRFALRGLAQPTRGPPGPMVCNAAPL